MEKYKLQIEILKVKLLFFSALVGGSFGYILKNNSFIVNLVLIIILFIGVAGVIKPLYNLGKIYKELKDKNE